MLFLKRMWPGLIGLACITILAWMLWPPLTLGVAGAVLLRVQAELEDDRGGRP